MTTNIDSKHPASARIERHVEVRLKDIGADHHFISTRAETINVSEYGLLMDVPSSLDGCVAQQVVASLHWDGGSFESEGEIVRFEGPFWRDPSKCVMAIRLQNPLPRELLTPDPA